MKNRIKVFLKELPTSIFYTVINPAVVMGFGFLFISGSVRAEKIAEWTGIELFSLYGLLNYDIAFEFSSQFQGYLDDYNLIPMLFFSGMVVIIIQRYRKLRKINSQKERLRKAMTLALFESLFMSGALFGGSLNTLQALFPDAISNTILILIVTVIGLGLGFLRVQLAKNLYTFIESHSIKHQSKK